MSDVRCQSGPENKVIYITVVINCLPTLVLAGTFFSVMKILFLLWMLSFCTGELPDYRSLQCFLSNEETGFVGISHCHFFTFLFNPERLEKRQGCNSIFRNDSSVL